MYTLYTYPCTYRSNRTRWRVSVPTPSSSSYFTEMQRYLLWDSCGWDVGLREHQHLFPLAGADALGVFDNEAAPHLLAHLFTQGGLKEFQGTSNGFYYGESVLGMYPTVQLFQMAPIIGLWQARLRSIIVARAMMKLLS